MDHYCHRKQALQAQLEDKERECGCTKEMLEAARLAKAEAGKRAGDLQKEVEAAKVREWLALSLWNVAGYGREEGMTWRLHYIYSKEPGIPFVVR